MKHVKKSILLWYSPHQMYTLVTAVEDYPQFLPWCNRVEIMQRDEAGLTARLHLVYAGVRQAFTTRNEHRLDESVHITLVDGPFSRLEGRWQFISLPEPNGLATVAADAPRQAASSPSPALTSEACKIDFELSYAFSSSALEAVISPVFDRIANTFVDAFVRRAEQVYGSH